MQELKAIIRHTLTTLGGGFVAKGMVTASELEAIAGALAIIAGLAWSIIEKRLAR